MKKRDDIYLREIESRIQKIASHLINYYDYLAELKKGKK